MNNNNNSHNSSYESIVKNASKKDKSVFRISKTYPAFLILILTLSLSFLAYNATKNQIQDDQQMLFDKATGSVMKRFASKHESNQVVLNSMRGLYDNLIQVVRDYFELYGSIPTDTYPSLLSIMYAQEVPAENMGKFVYDVMSQGYWNYKIHPEGSRDYYFPAQYIVPFENNGHLSGYDFATDSLVLDALQYARDNNTIVSTPIFNMRRPDTTGFYLIAPVYKKDSSRSDVNSRRKYFAGALMLEIDAKLFFEKALGRAIPTDTSIVFTCYDKDKNGKEYPVFTSANSSQYNKEYVPAKMEEMKLPIADRELIVKFKTIPQFGGQFQEYIPTTVLASSLMLSFVFFGFILSVITSRGRALDLAERMTRSQRRIVDSSKDIIAVLDFDGMWKTMNPAIETIFGLKPDGMIGQKIDPLFENHYDKENWYDLVQNAADEHTELTDIQMNVDNKEAKWINWSFTISKTDSLVYAIGRDVTLEKEAEEQAKIKSKQIQLAEQYSREASEFKTYFMTQLSHQMRNSLTGIIGYLQLLSQKIYETEEEHDSYLQLAEESSEEIFTFVSDIVDATLASDEDTGADITSFILGPVFKSAADDMTSGTDSRNISIELMDDTLNAKTVADKTVLKNALTNVYNLLAINQRDFNIQVSATENSHESATEIQIMGDANEIVSEMIMVFKDHKKNLIEILPQDKDDILLNLATAASNIRRMAGNMNVDTLGPTDGNIIAITLPLHKKDQ